MRVATNIAILPLYDPVRFAENTLVLDALSNGRLNVSVAIGYREIEEYDDHRLDLKQRGSRMDEACEILRRLWQGESVIFHGKHFQLNNVRVTPAPHAEPASAALDRRFHTARHAPSSTPRRRLHGPLGSPKLRAGCLRQDPSIAGGIGGSGANVRTTGAARDVLGELVRELVRELRYALVRCHQRRYRFENPDS